MPATSSSGYSRRCCLPLRKTECFSLQFSVPSSAILHKWLLRQGESLAEEMKRVFDNRIVGFSTLMEEV